MADVFGVSLDKLAKGFHVHFKPRAVMAVKVA